MSRFPGLLVLLLVSACQPALLAVQAESAVHRLAFSPRKPPVDAGSPERFTRSVRARYAASYRDFRFEVSGPLELRGRGPDDSPADIHLGEAYRDCQAEPASCERVVDRHGVVAGLAVYRAQVGVKRTEVFAAVRPTTYVEKLLVENPEAHVEPLVGDLRVIIENGLDQTVPTGPELAEIGLTPAATSTVARRNVTRRIGSPIQAFSAMTVPGTAVAARGELYDSSLLLAFVDWQTLADRWQLPIYVGVPATDELGLYVGSDQAAIAGLRDATATAFAEAAYPVSPQLYRFTGAGWEVVVPTAR